MTAGVRSSKSIDGSRLAAVLPGFLTFSSFFGLFLCLNLVLVAPSFFLSFSFWVFWLCLGFALAFYVWLFMGANGGGGEGEVYH